MGGGAKNAARTYHLNYTELIAPVIKAVQDIAARLEKLARLNPPEETVHIDALEKAVAEMKAELQKMKAAK